MARPKRDLPLNPRHQRLSRPQLTARNPLQQLLSPYPLVTTIAVFQTSIDTTPIPSTNTLVPSRNGRPLHHTQPFNAMINRPQINIVVGARNLSWPARPCFWSTNVSMSVSVKPCSRVALSRTAILHA